MFVATPATTQPSVPVIKPATQENLHFEVILFLSDEPRAIKFYEALFELHSEFSRQGPLKLGMLAPNSHS